MPVFFLANYEKIVVGVSTFDLLFYDLLNVSAQMKHQSALETPKGIFLRIYVILRLISTIFAVIKIIVVC